MEKLNRKTLYLCNSLSDGGGEKVFSYLYEEFKNVSVFSTIYDSYDFVGSSNRVISLTPKQKTLVKFRFVRLLFSFFRYSLLISNYKPKSVVSHIHLSNLFNVLGSFLFNYESYVVLHGFVSVYLKSNSLLKKIYGHILVFIYRKATKVVVISDGLADELTQLGVNNMVIYNPVFSSLITTSLEDVNLNLDPSKVNIIVIARLVETKRVEDILDSISKIDCVNLYIAGEGPLKNQLILKARELDIESRVFFVGFIKDINRVISSFDCLVSASEVETFGLTLLEGLLSGIPVVASNCDSGPREIFNITSKDGSGIIRCPGKGLLYDVGNIHQLESCINEVIESEIYKPTESLIQEYRVKYSFNQFFKSYENLTQ